MLGNVAENSYLLYFFIYIEVDSWKGLFWFSQGAFECMTKCMCCSPTKQKRELGCWTHRAWSGGADVLSTEVTNPAGLSLCLGCRTKKKLSLQVHRTADALSSNNLLAELGCSAKLSACIVVSSNVFLSYLSRSIWDLTATELLCWLLSVLLNSLVSSPDFEPFKISSEMMKIMWKKQFETCSLNIEVGVFPESIYFQTAWDCFQTWPTCPVFPEISGHFQYHIWEKQTSMKGFGNRITNGFSYSF